jgi:hypothetical protein
MPVSFLIQPAKQLIHRNDDGEAGAAIRNGLGDEAHGIRGGEAVGDSSVALEEFYRIFSVKPLNSRAHEKRRSYADTCHYC